MLKQLEQEEKAKQEEFYQKIKPPITRNQILRLPHFDKDSPLTIFEKCFYHAFDIKKDPETAKHLLNIFRDDLEQSDIGIFNLVKKTMTLLEYPDIFISDIVEVNGKKFLASDKWILEIYSRSKYNDPVLIIGETGTGKGILAKSIHEIGPRRNKKFQEINCAAISENLLESELFGHIKGSFTGAIRNKNGIFNLANHGTVFLDELGKMPKYLQAKILKVIEEKEIAPVGSEETIKIDVRFIAAAQPKDAEKIIPDLRNRLGFPDCIELPTLEQRLKSPEEIGKWLIGSSLKRLKDNMGYNNGIKISETAYRQLLKHKYPGNFRELENILKSAIRSTDIDGRTEIQTQDLVDILRKSMMFHKDKETSPSPDGDNLKNIKLKDLFDHADKIKASIIEAKIKTEMQRTGLDLKSLCEKEGIEYHNFRKKIVTITGKGIKEFGIK